jgi:hypothetical protein
MAPKITGFKLRLPSMNHSAGTIKLPTRQTAGAVAKPKLPTLVIKPPKPNLAGADQMDIDSTRPSPSITIRLKQPLLESPTTSPIVGTPRGFTLKLKAPLPPQTPGTPSQFKSSIVFKVPSTGGPSLQTPIKATPPLEGTPKLKLAFPSDSFTTPIPAVAQDCQIPISQSPIMGSAPPLSIIEPMSLAQPQKASETPIKTPFKLKLKFGASSAKKGA